MNQTLLKLISLFLSRVREAEGIMKEAFDIEEPMYFRQAGIARVGKIDSYSYSFHGIGCCFEFGDFEVDYDYAEDGRIDGFDLWRLSRFGEQYDEFKDYIASGKIKLDFNTADDSEEIVVFEQGNLYHLKKHVTRKLMNASKVVWTRNARLCCSRQPSRRNSIEH